MTVRSNDALEGADEKDVAAFWLDEIKRSQSYYEDWHHESERIYQRYRDERGTDARGAANSSWRLMTGQNVVTKRYNILWSNTETMAPAIYSQMPEPVVGRRYRDQDPLGRVASELYERVLGYLMDPPENTETFDDAMTSATQAYLLPGRAVTWVRYDAQFETLEAERVSEDPETGEMLVETYDDERKTGERVCFDDVYLTDFTMAPLSTLDMVWKSGWVGRRHYLTKKMAKDRFGEEKAKALTYSATPKEAADRTSAAPSNDGKTSEGVYAEVWEIWNKPDRRVYWVSKGYQDAPLDAKDDFLGLTNFYPCPKPVSPIMTPESTIPTPLYRQYADQATTLDRQVTKVYLLTTALRLAGFYPGEQRSEFQQLWNGVDQNTMIAVQDWSFVQSNGGMKGLIEYAPLEQVGQALEGLYRDIEANKQQIYEISGISDIMRGSTKASETLGAQRMKGQFGIMRLTDHQDKLEKYARDLLRISGEIAMEHFDAETIAEMTNFTSSEIAQDERSQQVFMQALQLLKDDRQRGYRIDVETSSTIFVDEENDKKQRIEFVTAVGGFLEKAAGAPPQMVPLLGEMLRYASRGFRGGRALEGSIDAFVDQASRQAEQAMQQGNQPSPEQIEAQQQAQMEQARLKLDTNKAKSDAVLEARGQDMDMEKKRMELGAQSADAKRQTALKLVETMARGGNAA